MLYEVITTDIDQMNQKIADFVRKCIVNATGDVIVQSESQSRQYAFEWTAVIGKGSPE